MDWSSFSDWGNLASIVGFVVTLGGLAVVGWQAWGAKQAAEQTKQAAEQTRTAVANVLTFGSGNPGYNAGPRNQKRSPERPMAGRISSVLHA